MAGDWLKFEKATLDKPEVFAIASGLGLDPDAVVGKLLRVWSWFDTHTTSGNARSVTAPLLDRISGVSGFAEAMRGVGWLDVDATGVSLPKFERHTGETAKGRALTAKRVAKHKETGNANTNAASVSAALPREEKRREDKKQKKNQKTAPSGVDFGEVSPQVVTDFTAHRKAQRAPITQTALDAIRKEASKAGLTLEAALAMCCARGWRGFKADWVTQPNARAGPLTASPGKTMGAIQHLEDLKNGLADTRNSDRVPETALLGSGSHPRK